jgi:hypothetical protein
LPRQTRCLSSFPKRVHRHSLGDVIYTRTITPSEGEIVRLTTKLDDHLGSTDVLISAVWNSTNKAFTHQSTEYQAFDPWGERANVANATPYRQNDTDPFRRSAQDYDRGIASVPPHGTSPCGLRDVPSLRLPGLQAFARVLATNSSMTAASST